MCVCQNIQYVYKFVCSATQAIKSEGGRHVAHPPCHNWQYLLVCEYVCLSVCVCAGAHVTECWAIDLLLAISRICCQDMLGICWLSCFHFPPSPTLPLLNIDYRKSISGACHMLICPVYGPTSFVRTFFVARVCVLLSPASLPCPASASLCLSINSRFRPQCLIPVYCRCYNSACCPVSVPRSKCNFKLALQHHRLHSKLACPKITYRIPRQV